MRNNLIIYTQYYMEGVIEVVESTSLDFNILAHRTNILNTSLHYFGAGYAAEPEANNVYSTQNFTR